MLPHEAHMSKYVLMRTPRSWLSLWLSVGCDGGRKGGSSVGPAVEELSVLAASVLGRVTLRWRSLIWEGLFAGKEQCTVLKSTGLSPRARVRA